MSAPLVLPDTLEQLNFRPTCETGHGPFAIDTPCEKPAAWSVKTRCCGRRRACAEHLNRFLGAAADHAAGRWVYVCACERCGRRGAPTDHIASIEPLR